jgi:FMN reductase
MSVAVVVGNPKPRSRTWQAAHLVAEKITGSQADLSADLVDLGAALLDWQDQQVAELVAAVAASDLLIVASPTYKATYTGLLKLFLDRIAGGALAAVTAVPVMLGGDWRHSLAADMLLKPVGRAGLAPAIGPRRARGTWRFLRILRHVRAADAGSGLA